MALRKRRRRDTFRTEIIFHGSTYLRVVWAKGIPPPDWVYGYQLDAQIRLFCYRARPEIGIHPKMAQVLFIRPPAIVQGHSSSVARLWINNDRFGPTCRTKANSLPSRESCTHGPCHTATTACQYRRFEDLKRSCKSGQLGSLLYLCRCPRSCPSLEYTYGHPAKRCGFAGVPLVVLRLVSYTGCPRPRGTPTFRRPSASGWQTSCHQGTVRPAQTRLHCSGAES